MQKTVTNRVRIGFGIMIEQSAIHDTVLVVDDEEQIRSILNDILEREGYTVVTASDGYEAINKIDSEEFSLAVVDIQIPGPSGIEILKNIKGSGKDTEVVIISGYASVDNAIEAMRQGAYDYIVKPFDINTIPETIKRGFDRYKQNIETKQLLNNLERKTYELNVISELREYMGYTLDYKELVRPIMVSLRNVIPHDISAFLYITGEKYGELNIWAGYGHSSEAVAQIKQNVMNVIQSFSDSVLSEEGIYTYVNEFDSIASDIPSNDLKTSTNAALLINDGDKKIFTGVINISSYKENAFDPDKIELFYEVANNISNALERLRKVLAGEKYRLEMMIKNMNEGVLIFDQRGPITVINPVARRMLRLDKSSDVEYLVKCIGKSRISKVLDRVWKGRDSLDSILGGEGFEEEIQMDNPRNILNANISPIRGSDGKTYGVMTIFRDITRQREIDEAKSAFVSSVSHELRTPLTAIKNAMSIINMAGELNDQQRKFLTTSTRNIDRLERLINRILDFSKLEDGKMEMEFDFVDLKTLVNNSMQDIRDLAEKKSIKLVENIHPNVPYIYADYYRLDQVFTNILDNAIKYTPQNGRITIDAELVDSSSIGVNPDNKNGILSCAKFAKVIVSDTGVGISLEDQQKIFDRFEQAGKPYNIGVGLGLSIVKKIIENHNGKIWVESKPGKGSKFIFILPIDQKCNNIVNLIWAVNNEIEYVKDKENVLYIMLIQVKDFSEIIAEQGDSIASKILEDIVYYIENNTHTKKTITYKSEEHGFIFSLYHGDKYVLSDIEEQIKEFVNRKKFPVDNYTINSEVEIWLANYPDDGADAVEIIDNLVQSCVPDSE
ncbi:response regulator [Candidatus Poribacteria bacterium]|nr:response regulator [Candidatus Poribacteria bacterium]